MNQVALTKYSTVGRRTFFSSEDSCVIYGGAEVWQGYWQSLRPGQSNLFDL